MKCTNCSNCETTMVFMDGSKTMGCSKNPNFEQINKNIHLIEGEDLLQLEEECAFYREER